MVEKVREFAQPMLKILYGRVAGDRGIESLI